MANQTQSDSNPYKVPAGEATFSESRGFSGVNLWSDPQDLTGNYLLQGDNTYLRSGVLYIRPGAQAQLTSANPAAPYWLANMLDASGNLWLIYVVQVSGSGRLYKQEFGTSSVTELLTESGGHYNIANGAQADVLGNYLYIVDGGSHSEQIRVNLTAGYPAYSMEAPPIAPTLSLTDLALDPSFYSGWVQDQTDTANPANLFVNSALMSGITWNQGASGAFASYQTGDTTGSGTEELVQRGPTMDYHNTVWDPGTTSPITAYSVQTVTATSNGSTTTAVISGSVAEFGTLLIVLTSANGNTAGTVVSVTRNTSGTLTFSPALAHATASGDTFYEGGAWGLFDAAGSGFSTYETMGNVAVEPAGSGSYGDSARMCTQFLVQMRYYQGDPTGQANVTVQISAWGDSAGTANPTTLLGITNVTLGAQYASQQPGQMVSAIVDFPNLGVQIASLQMGVFGGPNNVGGKSFFFCSAISLFPLNNNLNIATSSGNNQIQISQIDPASSNVNIGNAANISYAGKLGGARLTKDYTAGNIQNWSSWTQIAIPLTNGPAMIAAGLSFCLGFRATGSTTHYLTSPVTFSADGTYAYVNTSATIPTSIISAFRFLEIVFLADLALSSIVSPLLTLGPVAFAGNLTSGAANYTYWTTEAIEIDWDSGTGPTPYASGNLFESNPSAQSAAITTTLGQAEVSVTLPEYVGNSGSPYNAAGSHPANQGTFYGVYRTGGAWDDMRLIAYVPSGSSVGSAGSNSTDTYNPYYSWNHTTGVFIDNTPNSWLQLAPLGSFARNPMPTNAQAIVAANGRLLLGVGNILYISWLYNATDVECTYTTLVNDSTDPNAPIEGFFSAVGADPTDTIVRMATFGTPVLAGEQFGTGVVIFCKRSVWLLQGNSAITTNNAVGYSLTPYDYTRGVGLVAANGVARLSANELVFMGPDRLHAFPPHLDSPLSDMGLIIQPQLYAVSPDTQQVQSALALSSLCYHDSKIFVNLPVPGDAAPDVLWVYDLREKGWTRWSQKNSATLTSANMSGTSMCSVQPNPVNGQYTLLLFGTDGQVYAFGGVQDTAVAGGTATNIFFSVTVHAMRPGFFYRYRLRPLYYYWARLEEYLIEMAMYGALTITITPYTFQSGGPVARTAHIYTKTYNLRGGGRGFRAQPRSGLVEGEYIEFNITGNVSALTYLRGIRGWISQTGQEVAG